MHQVVFAEDHLVSNIDDANKQLNNAKAGDKIILKDGVYKNAVIKFINNNVSFTAEHAGKVFFEGNSTLNFAGDNITVDGFVWQNGGFDLKSKSVIEFKAGDKEATHSFLKNCAINEYNNADISIDNKWVSVYGEYNTVTQCLFKSKFNLGATLVVWLTNGKAAHHTISYNYFLNRQNGPNSDNGLESMRIGDSRTSMIDAHCTVAFNRFEECDGEIEIISNKSCHNSYLHNTFVNSDGGITLRHGNNCLVDGNFFDGENKKLSYGVRFIGEGHVAINNYFYRLNGAPNQTFRAPFTVVNGLVNTPQNGYFQSKRCVFADNIFVDCVTPVIRIGAFSKREGMILPPDSLTIKNNIIFDDAGKAGEVYEDATTPQHITYTNNKVYGQYLTINQKGFDKEKGKTPQRDGFNYIKDANGNTISSINNKAALVDNKGVGADYTDAFIAKEAAKTKYSYLSAKEVGPVWMR